MRRFSWKFAWLSPADLLGSRAAGDLIRIVSSLFPKTPFPVQAFDSAKGWMSPLPFAAQVGGAKFTDQPLLRSPLPI
jgi:hypothetical protein